MSSTLFCCSPRQGSTFLFTLFCFLLSLLLLLTMPLGVGFLPCAKIKWLCRQQIWPFLQPAHLTALLLQLSWEKEKMKPLQAKLSRQDSAVLIWSRRVFNELIFLYLLFTLVIFPKLWSLLLSNFKVVLGVGELLTLFSWKKPPVFSYF